MSKKRTHNLGIKLPSRVYFKHGAFYFVTRANKWHRLGTDYRKALEQYELLESNIKKISVIRDMIARYIVEELPKLAEKTQETERQFIKNIRIAFGDWSPEDLKPLHIYQYLDARTAKISANREIIVLKKVFDCGIRWGIIESNPCIGVKLHASEPRTRHVTLREFVAVKNMATSQLAVIMEFAFITAARQGEIIALNKSDVSKDGLTLRDSKTSQTFLINLSPRLLRVLGKCTGKSEALFENESNRRFTSAGFKSCWRRVMQKALAAGKIKESFTFHDIRASAITYMANKEGLEAARNVAGHKTTEMTGRVYYRGVKARKTTR